MIDIVSHGFELRVSDNWFGKLFLFLKRKNLHMESFGMSI